MTSCNYTVYFASVLYYEYIQRSVALWIIVGNEGGVLVAYRITRDARRHG